jgi:hypothetical protein
MFWMDTVSTALAIAKVEHHFIIIIIIIFFGMHVRLRPHTIDRRIISIHLACLVDARLYVACRTSYTTRLLVQDTVWVYRVAKEHVCCRDIVHSITRTMTGCRMNPTVEQKR